MKKRYKLLQHMTCDQTFELNEDGSLPSALFQELPESQEEGFEDDGCICAEYDGKGKSTCGIPCPVHFKPQKEECKHENMSAWACRGCGMTCAEAAKDWSKRLQEGVKTALSPQPKQKPEEDLSENGRRQLKNQIKVLNQKHDELWGHIKEIKIFLNLN